jgi:hypothetical protein
MYMKLNLSQVLTAYFAYLTGKGSFRLGARTITIANTGVGPVKFTAKTALAAAEAAVLLDATTGTIYPQTIVIGSTSVTVS